MSIPTDKELEKVAEQLVIDLKINQSTRFFHECQSRILAALRTVRDEAVEASEARADAATEQTLRYMKDNTDLQLRALKAEKALGTAVEAERERICTLFAGSTAEKFVLHAIRESTCLSKLDDSAFGPNNMMRDEVR